MIIFFLIFFFRCFVGVFFFSMFELHICLLHEREKRIQELFLTLYESLPLVVAEPDRSSKRGSSYKFASGRRVLGFLTFLASRNCFDSGDLTEVFEEPQGFKIENLKNLYNALLKYAEDRAQNGDWHLDFAGPVNAEEELRKRISKCFVRVHQRLQFLTL